jgi:hypothetical protein
LDWLSPAKERRMKRTVGALVIGTLAIGLAFSLASSAYATLEIQKGAKAAGVAVPNCLYCHNEKLPKKGAATHNDRGKWLIAEKERMKAKAVDGAWLKNYAEPKK